MRGNKLVKISFTKFHSSRRCFKKIDFPSPDSSEKRSKLLVPFSGIKNKEKRLEQHRFNRSIRGGNSRKLDDAVLTKGEFGCARPRSLHDVAMDPITRSRTIDVERSTTGDERQTRRRRGRREEVYQQLLPSASPTVSLLFAELSSGEVSRRQPSLPGYEIASLPRGVITKNQAKRPKSHHRASTLFLQFWRGAIDTHAGPLRPFVFEALLSLSLSLSVSIPPRPRRSREPSGKYVGRKGILGGWWIRSLTC